MRPHEIPSILVSASVFSELHGLLRGGIQLLRRTIVSGCLICLSTPITQVIGVVLEEGTLVKKMLPLNWPTGKPVVLPSFLPLTDD